MSSRFALQGLILIDAIAFVGVGAVVALGLAGMLEYGNPVPSAEVVLGVFVAKFVLVPAIALFVLGKLAFHLLHNRGELAAYAVIAVPLLCWPFFLIEALK